MESILKNIMEKLPWFLDTFVTVTTNPVKFVTSKSSDDEQSMKDALLFVGISFVAAMLLTYIKSKEPNLWLIASEAVVQLILVMLWVPLLVVSWRLVGISADFRTVFIFQTYFFGAFLPLFPFGQFVMEGSKLAYGQTAYQLSGVIIGAIMVAWGSACWNAYRHRFAASAFRAIASSIFAALSAGVMFFVASAVAAYVNKA